MKIEGMQILEKVISGKLLFPEDYGGSLCVIFSKNQRSSRHEENHRVASAQMIHQVHNRWMDCKLEHSFATVLDGWVLVKFFTLRHFIIILLTVIPQCLEIMKSFSEQIMLLVESSEF